eukprot:COSAG02_NODE_416_length_22749_cov_21.264059_2_plen_122_part_00
MLLLVSHVDAVPRYMYIFATDGEDILTRTKRMTRCVGAAWDRGIVGARHSLRVSKKIVVKLHCGLVCVGELGVQLICTCAQPYPNISSTLSMAPACCLHCTHRVQFHAAACANSVDGTFGK